jgi:hypothetical protein
MKRIATLFVAVSLLSFAGCKKKEEAKPAEPAAEPAAKPAEPAAAPAAADPAAAPAAADPAAAAAPAGDDMSTGIAECDELVKRYTACDKMPPEAKAAFMEGAKAWKQGAAGGDAAKTAITDACKQAATAADAQMKQIGC